MITYLYKKLLLNLLAVLILLLFIFLIDPNLSVTDYFSTRMDFSIFLNALFWGTIFSSAITYYELHFQNELPIFDNLRINIKKHLISFATIGPTIDLVIKFFEILCS